MNLQAPAIQLQDLRKDFPKRAKAPFWRRTRPEMLVAVDGVSLQVPAGEFFGLLGPNGAGKTTTVRMICTLLEPTAGSVRVFGHDVVRQANEVRRRIGGLLAGERSLYWKLSGRENLDYFAALYRIPARQSRGRIDEVLQQVGLLDRAEEYVERYSHGMRQRLMLARALLPNPPLLVLDEPTIGLDPQAARNFRELLRALHASGTTILLTTHYMEEADQLCERIGVIDHGKIIALDSPTALKRGLEERKVVEIEAAGSNGAAVERLRALPGVTQVLYELTPEGVSRYHVHSKDPRAVLGAVIDLVGRDGARLEHIRVVEPTLEDVFIALTGRTLRE